MNNKIIKMILCSNLIKMIVKTSLTEIILCIFYNFFNINLKKLKKINEKFH